MPAIGRRHASGSQADVCSLVPGLTGFCPAGDALLSLCEQLVKDYNSLGLRLLDNGAYESAYEMLKKAELLTEPSSSLRARPLARLKLRAITFNNLGERMAVCSAAAKSLPAAWGGRESWKRRRAMMRVGW